ncbi:hypothetical protein CF8_1669 [Nocardioides sp. CF8]|nr:hypothetical protein CF8_1669 [Nocardioides sp. CF8]
MVRDLAEERALGPGLQRVPGFKSYETAWAWMHTMRRATVRPERDRLSGIVEVDETFVGGVAAGQMSRPTTIVGSPPSYSRHTSHSIPRPARTAKVLRLHRPNRRLSTEPSTAGASGL